MARGNVESWLGELLNQQQKSLHGVIREASVVIGEENFQLLEFLGGYPAQVPVPVSVRVRTAATPRRYQYQYEYVRRLPGAGTST